MPAETVNFSNARDEMNVLAAALKHPANRDRFAAMLRPEDFTTAEGKVIAWGLLRAQRESRAPDPRSFHTLVDDCPLGTSFGGPEMMAQLAAVAREPIADFDALAGKVRVAGAKDRAISALHRAAEIAGNPTKDLSELRHSIEDARGILDAAASRDDLGFKTPRQINESYYAVLRERMAGNAFFPTGLAPLDEALHEGFLPGRMSVLAGRPSTGKTTFVTNLAYRMAARRTGTVAFFSIEAPDIAIWDKFNSIATGIPLLKLGKQADQLTVEEKQLLMESMRARESMPLEVNDNKTFTLAGMEDAISTRWRAGRKFDVVIIDLFSRAEEFDSDSSGYGSQTLQIGTALKRIQQIAQRLGFHALLVVQIGRFEKAAGWKRHDHARRGRMPRPTEDDLYGSDQYLQYCDNLFLLHRCHHYDPVRYRDDVIEVWIRKQRYGEPSVRCFEFEKETGRVKPSSLFPVDFSDEERVKYAYRLDVPTFARTA